MNEKERCKKDILKLLKNLEIIIDEAEKEGHSANEIETDLFYYNVDSFSKALSKNTSYSKYTARDAINELESTGAIAKTKHGFYELATNSKDISKIVKYSMYITLLPVMNQPQGTYYMEVPNNSAQFLADLFNQSVSRNDKRFYAVAHNLLLMLDLELSAKHNIIEKKPFDLKSFIKTYGIGLRDYETILTPIEGFTNEEINEIEELNYHSASSQDAYEENRQEEYSGEITPKRKITVKRTGQTDTE